MKQKLLWLLPLLSLTWFAGTIALAGNFYPNYNHLTQFISELGATGSPVGDYVNYLGFIPTELFILSFVCVSYSVLPKTKSNVLGLISIAIYGFTLGVAALFPCDFECRPHTPTISHTIHMASALPGYLCGILAIFFISAGSNGWSESSMTKSFGYAVGVLAFLAFGNLEPSTKYVGLYQRALEFLIYSWLIFFGYSLSKNLPDKQP